MSSIPRGRVRFGYPVAIAWLGFLVHNVADLPDESLWSPSTLVPSLVFAALLLVVQVARLLGAWLLLGWAALNLVGGALVSVLPLPILPFSPEQSWRHYSFHVLYGVAQLPLICATWSRVRPGRADHPGAAVG